jgi:hypothetical protein
MKQRILSITMVVFTTLFLTSCDTDLAKPKITISELGYDNSKTVNAGKDLHIEGEIVAEGKIDKIMLTIHPEGEHKSTLLNTVHHEWEVDTTYTKFAGLKNTSFHEHLEVPQDAETGHYHLHLKVIDMEGNSSEFEAEIEVLEPIE